MTFVPRDTTLASSVGTADLTAPRLPVRRRVLASLLAALLLCVSASGCNYIVLLGYLIGGPPSIEPDYDAMTDKSMTDKEVVVAVACFAPKDVLYDYAGIDRELARFVAQRLYTHKMTVIQPDVVQQWIDENPDFDKPEEIGKGVGATHVISIDLTNFTLYEKSSHQLYRGRSEGMISVVEINKDGEGGEQLYTKEMISVFPLAVPRSTQDIGREAFKAQYLTRLSEEIGRLFYEHYTGDDMSDAT